MDRFYLYDCNATVYHTIELQSTNWDDAIAEAKSSHAYAKLTYPKYMKKKLHVEYDYVEVIRNKMRKNLNFEDFRNPDIYRRVY